MSTSKAGRFVGPVDRLLYFRSLGMGGTVNNTDLASLAYEAKEVFVRAGTELLRGDEPVEKVYIAVEGKFEIDAGDFVEVAEAPIGLNWLRLHGRFDTNRPVRAITDSLLLEIQGSRMLDLLERNPRGAEDAFRGYADHLLRIRGGLPVHPADEKPADPGTPPTHELTLIQRLKQVTGPGSVWEHANLDAVLGLVWAMEEVQFKKGEVLWKLGDASEHIWRIVCGTVRCTNVAGRSVELGAGSGLGVNCSLAAMAHCFGAVATHDGVALLSRVDATLAVVENHSDMRLGLLAGVARTLSNEYDADYLRRKENGEPPLAPIGVDTKPYAEQIADELARTRGVV